MKKLVDTEITITLLLIFISVIIYLGCQMNPFIIQYVTTPIRKVGPGTLLHIFGHANRTHLTNNIIVLALIGPLAEEKYGSIFTAIMTVLTAVVVGLTASFIGQSCWGLSSIVFMMIMMSLFNNEGGIPLVGLIAAAAYIIPEIQGLFINDGVAHQAHLIGGLMGLLAGLFVSIFCSKK